MVQKTEKEESMCLEKGRMTYATQFYIHHDWLKGALSKYGYLAKMRAKLEKEVKQHMDRFKIGIQFIQEDGYVNNVDEIVLETKNLLDELLRLKDVNLIRTKNLLHNN